MKSTCIKTILPADIERPAHYKLLKEKSDAASILSLNLKVIKIDKKLILHIHINLPHIPLISNKKLISHYFSLLVICYWPVEQCPLRQSNISFSHCGNI